ncbi:MAG: glycosyltransferase family 1 protein [Patescibacteria group bacterium]
MNSPLHIGIDARMFGPRVGGGGPGRYVEQLILHLQAQDDHNCYTLFCKRENFGDIPLPNKRWTKIVTDVHWYTLAEQLVMPRAIDKHKLDLIHFPHFNVPLRVRTPFVVTIHDLIMLEQPWSARATTRNRLLFELKRIGFRKTLRHAVKNARHIITVSNHAKSQIIHRLGASPKSISVVYNGIDIAVPKTASTKQKSKSGSSILSRIKTPYIFNVSNSYPHKNIETLLHTFSFLLQEHPNVTLVLAGPSNEFQDRLREEAREIAIPDDRILFTGFVSDDELTALYANAVLYVIPSKVEGFGIPPLEALRLGTPVAASRTSCIPEILGEAAVYFNPDDIESMLDAMEQLLTDRSLKTSLLSKSHDVLARYRWDDAASQTLQIYEQTFSL